jgi:superfamily II DNA or RNA helicase
MAEVYERGVISIRMPSLEVRTMNSAHLRVVTENAVAHELQDYFTFEVPGAKFTPAYKRRVWDGKVRLFNAYSGLLPAGLLDYLAVFARDRGYEMRVDSAVAQPEVRHDCGRVREMIEALKPTSGGQPLVPHDHQVEAVCHALNQSRCVLLSPTASGKSLVIYSLCRYYQQAIAPTRKILIVVPTISLVAQMYADFRDYSETVRWDADANCHRIVGGETKLTDKQIVISTWQSIYKMPRAWFDNFEVVIGDEAHLFKAQSLNGIMNKLVDCPYRIALTGTLDGSKIHKLAIEGLFGPVHKVVTTKELMDRNLLTNLRIECIMLRYPPEVRKSVCGLDYQNEIEWLVGCEKRNDFIAHLASACRGNTLVLFNFVEKHGKPLYENIKRCASTVIEGRKVYFVAGETELAEREEIRGIVEKEENAIIVASYGTFSTGINIKSLRNVIFASPSKSRIRVLQSIGRQLRKAQGKDIAKLYDLADDLHDGENLNYTLKHFLKRMRIYEAEEFRYKLVKMPLDMRIERPRSVT